MIRSHLKRRARSGMSLIEVLCALAIFLMSLTAISNLVDSGTNRAIEASKVTIGTRLAQSKLAEVESGVLAMSDASGTFDVEEGWEWKITIGTQVASNTYEVTATAWNKTGLQVPPVALTQVIFDPIYMGNAAAAQPPTTATTGGTTP